MQNTIQVENQDLELYSTDCQPFLHDKFHSNDKYMPRFQQTKIYWLRFTSQNWISRFTGQSINNRRLTEAWECVLRVFPTKA